MEYGSDEHLDGLSRGALKSEVRWWWSRAKEMEAENAKLRELVRDMLRWMPCPHPCGRCERYHYPNGCEFELRRRELGVEVNG